MHNSSLTVVISAGQSRNPEKRQLESAIAEGASELANVNILKIPHLYDLAPASESFAALKTIPGDLVLVAWLFDRAAHWVLDRNGIRGQVGEVELKQDFGDDEEDEDESQAETERVVDSQPRPERSIYCLDFKASDSADEFVREIQRIAQLKSEPAPAPATAEDSATDSSTSTPLTLSMLQRFEEPTNDTYVGSDASARPASATLFGTTSQVTIDEHPGRRWYPVIDFSRCTNCMECIDFCLFGVYGVDGVETIVVEQADNCRKGCPACSRVCPENAIIFPQHKTPAIAGAPVDTGGMKIDLSKLFGAPDSGEDAAEVAARERDEQLILAGREAVGAPTGIEARLAEKKSTKADELDDLIDELDSLDL